MSGPMTSTSWTHSYSKQSSWTVYVLLHRRLFSDPVKPQRCTTEPVRPLDGINKDVGGANYC